MGVIFDVTVFSLTKGRRTHIENNIMYIKLTTKKNVGEHLAKNCDSIRHDRISNFLKFIYFTTEKKIIITFLNIIKRDFAVFII